MTQTPAASTPLRSLDARSVDGVQVVRETGAAWLDGSEDALFDRMDTSGLPLDSMSDELLATATSWPERYHLSPARANVVRSLDLPRDATVLEVGAGCGAITRYLGETCATVDALEPTFARARVAARRTAELPGVRVFNAEISDLPPVPAYDVVVVVGVLEYVGGGGDDPAPYLEFLSALRAVLRPGGKLVLAIENALGVKYLAGAPEDHSNKVFHSVEGYPEDGPARTFSRRVLEDLVRRAGFVSTRTLGAFPDYKLTRVVLDDGLFADAPMLALDVPSFPSPDWVAARPALIDEGLLWGELVKAGVGTDFVNSFIVVADADDSGPSLWPEARLARYFSMQRRHEFQVLKTVESRDGVAITSRRLGVGEADGLAVLPYRDEWTEGRSLVAHLWHEPGRFDELVGDWIALLEKRTAESAEGVPFDVLPHNVHYDATGRPRIIDDEWRSTAPRDVQLRGALLLTRDLLLRDEPSRWGVDGDWRALVRRVLAVAGREVDDTEIDAAITAEARLQADVHTRRGTSHHAEVARTVEEQLRASLEESTGGRRAPGAWTSEAAAIEARDLLFTTGEQLGEARAELAEVRSQLVALRTKHKRVSGELDALRGAYVELRQRPLRSYAARIARRLRRTDSPA